MSYEEIQVWLGIEVNAQLFRPTNRRPTEAQRLEVFEIANFLQPKGNHKPTGCGRCYYNALRAIEKSLNIF